VVKVAVAKTATIVVRSATAPGAAVPNVPEGVWGSQKRAVLQTAVPLE